MSRVMTDVALREKMEDLVRDIKSEKDLSAFTGDLIKLTVETALNTELTDHLGYPKHSAKGRGSGDSRNGHYTKRLLGEHGAVPLEVPRDRNGDFTPQIVGKGQTRLTRFDNQILSLYAKGMSTRDIVEAFREMYGAEISAGLVSKVTESVLDRIMEWQVRPLDALYPVVYLDCIVLKIRQDKRVINKSIYLALGINMEGRKELLGLWLSETEGSKFWLSVLTELQNRGVNDIFIACVDGLTGFPEAIRTVYPKARIQLCIVHMVRNSLKFVSWKDRKAVATDLKAIYKSVTEEEAVRELECFSIAWDKKYPSISQSWRNHWPDLIPLFDYPDEIRKIIYTTNAIESLNSVVAKAVQNRKIFPNDRSALKVVYLAVEAASRKWSMPLRDWKPALNRFLIEYESDKIKSQEKSVTQNA